MREGNEINLRGLRVNEAVKGFLKAVKGRPTGGGDIPPPQGFMPGGCTSCDPTLGGGCGCPPHRSLELSLNDYQFGALQTDETPDQGFEYFALGVAGEAGELVEQVKKHIRDDDALLTPERQEKLVKELGDVMWYLAVMADRLDVTLEEVATANLEKLADRKARNAIKGEGDDR